MNASKAIWISLCIGSAFAWFSCQPLNYGQAPATLDSAEQVIEEWKRTLSGPRLVQVDSLHRIVKAQTDTLLRQFTDTSDRYFWVDVISDYANVAKKIGDFEENRKALMDELETSLHQLDDLRVDVQNEALSPLEVDSFLQEELRIMADLEQEVELRVNQSEKVWLIYTEKSPEIQRYLNNL
jgi:hypothetical protein